MGAANGSRGVVEAYVPERGDIVWLSFDPHTGHEQAGRRPALVLSPVHYNARVRLFLCCPITSRAKGYPWEVQLPAELQIGGVVLADQVRSFDWDARTAEFIEVAPPEVVDRVVGRLRRLL